MNAIHARSQLRYWPTFRERNELLMVAHGRRVVKPAARVLHNLGPFRDPSDPPEPFPYERLNGKPLVYASFGTLQNNRKESFRVIAAVCADLDVQLVITTGRGCVLDPAHLPGTPIVVDYAPQLDLLKRSTLCIAHAGSNTVMDSLSCGSNGRRLRSALQRVLGVPHYRHRARQLQVSIERAGGVDRAVEIVEQVLERHRFAAPAPDALVAK